MTFVACDDTTDTIGTSLTDKLDNLSIVADTFNVTTKSVIADSVLSRNTIGYLGKVKDPETSAYITSNFMAQFHTLDDYAFPAVDSVLSKDNGQVIADSCEIRLYFTDYFGDSLSVMKLTTYEMNKPMEEGVNYYSNFNPISEGLVRTSGGINQSKTYTLIDFNVSDSLRSTDDYTPNIRITLNKPYKDKDGNVYNNYGTYIMRKYYENPNYFKNSYNFIHNVCPGFFFKMNSGLGSMAYISVCQLNLYFQYKNDTTTYTGTTSFAGTEEVLQATNTINDKEAIKEMASDNSCTYLKTPAGIFTEMTLPIDEIIKGHENDTINTAKVSLSRINNTVQSEFSLGIPKTLLMIPRDSIYSFFANEDIANYRSSFIASYNSSYNNYTFNNIGSLITYLYNKKKVGGDNWTASHPNWNKVIIIPVTTTVNSSSQLTKVVHDMSMCSTKLVGGSENNIQPIKISLIYSKFK